MSEPLVLYSSHNGIGTITLNRPDKLNALSPELLEAFSVALDQAGADRLRGLLVTGAGRAFAAGADIATMADFKESQGRAWATRGQGLMDRLADMPCPTLAAVNGFALGGGCEIAIACDLRFASEDAVLGQPEVKIGVIPGFGGTQRLGRLIGLSRAKDLIYSGRNVKADEAYRMGLVDRVVPGDQLIDIARGYLADLGTNAPIAIRFAKRALDKGVWQDLPIGNHLERDLFALCFGSADQKEGMKAFLEKRPAQYKDE